MSREQAGEWVADADGGAFRSYPSGRQAARAYRGRDGRWVVASPKGVVLESGCVRSAKPDDLHGLARAACDDALRAAGHLPPLRKAGRPPTRGAAATRAVRVRLTPDEHAAVVAAASARGESLSEYVRGRVL